MSLWSKVVGVFSKGKVGDLTEKVTDSVVKVRDARKVNVENERERDQARVMADKGRAIKVLDQYSKEFHQPTNWFDSLINGANRLVRPMLAYSVASVFIAYNVTPFVLFTTGTIGGAEFVELLESMLKIEAALIGAVFSFYFGVGGLEKIADKVGDFKFSQIMKEKEVEEKKINAEVEKEKIKKGVVGDDFIRLEVKPGAPDNVKKFFKKHKKTIIDIERDYDLCAVGVIAHAALECGWGEKILRAKDVDTHQTVSTNNIFNIKVPKQSEWNGRKAYRDVWEDYDKDGKYDKDTETEKAFFKVYPTLADSFRDYATLLTTLPRYAKMTEATNARQYGEMLYECGYMTDGKAADKIESIAEAFFDYET